MRPVSYSCATDVAGAIATVSADPDSAFLAGGTTEVDLLRHLVSGKKNLDSPVGDLAEGDYATVSPDTKIELLQSVLADAKSAIVTDKDDVVGIVTKIDLIDFLARAASADGPRSGRW